MMRIWLKKTKKMPEILLSQVLDPRPKAGSLTSAGPDACGLDVVLGFLQKQCLKLPSQFWAQRLLTDHLLWRTDVTFKASPNTSDLPPAPSPYFFL